MFARRLRQLVCTLGWALPVSLTALTIAPSADAFCGFYVAGADQKLFNNATMVVMMRDGTRTVLSMQNNYQGPPQNFAMVVPVPVVLQKENVKTLTDEVFDRIDKLAAPRLVEYWEQDPCAPPSLPPGAVRKMSASPARGRAESDSSLGVKIEAQFQVGEYEVVILSANDSLGLDTWLRQNSYKIPDGAEPYLRPYVQEGSKFFVAKVDVTKVRFEQDMAKLSPLRFHYDSETFRLPVRLGLINSSGTQDLIVHILARGQRYELANYKNVTVPTNIDVDDKTRNEFGAFYAALFDRTLEENPGAVVTEYAWDASSCDPCPTPALSPSELATFGADVLPDAMNSEEGTRGRRIGFGGGSFVVTRLHARYKKDALGEDLVFRTAGPILGGREIQDESGKLEVGSKQAGFNNFQARYAIRHPWTGPIACANPVRGNWGGPPQGTEQRPAPKAAQDLAFAPRGNVQLASFLKQDVPEIRLKPTLLQNPQPLATPTTQPQAPTTAQPQSTAPTATEQPQGSCGGCAIGSKLSSPSLLFAIGSGVGCWLGLMGRRKQRKGRK